MLFRIVRPMRRSDSQKHQFKKRIPADVRARAVGREVTIKLADGEAPVRLTITPAMARDAVRFSLRTADAAEAKVRNALVATQLETLWAALRRPQTALSHHQSTALAGDLYRAWASPGGSAIAVIHTPHGFVPASPRESDEEEEAMFAAAIAHVEGRAEEDLEATFGPLVDRLLLTKGVASVDAESRGMLLQAFHKALLDALEARKRQAGGDYSPYPKAHRFPGTSQRLRR
jgi:hypothetical protein